MPPDRFVNPYTFVPFPDEMAPRREPHGHCGAGDLWSGTIGIRITARTPLLVRGTAGAGKDTLPHRTELDGSIRQIVPGSSLHGAFRSLHETLTGSCLRVFDQEFTPVYWDAAVNTGGLVLAIVDEVDHDGRPTRLQRCEPVTGTATADYRVHHSVLRAAGGTDGIRSGQRLSIDVDPAHDEVARVALDDQGDWVVFISHAQARTGSEYFAALRKLTDEVLPGVPDDVWADFQVTVRGTDDVRTAEAGSPPLVPVHWPRESDVVVGRRYRASERLQERQPIWLRFDDTGKKIIRIQLAQLWRHRGTTASGLGTKPAGAEIKDASGSRVPPLAKACTDAGSLCPSCRLFGCADTREDDAQRPSHADQQSYRGHVRFSDAVAEGEVTGLVMTLPPMGAPHPGAGQFYLDAAEGMPGNGTLPPLREWGSAADRYGARRLRGRKFYWHTSVDDGPLPRRGAAREHHKAEEHEKTVTEAAAFPCGTVFTASVTVVDVTMDQIGALLATLRPELVLSGDGGADRDLVVHIGGGRPLGYGSCTITLDASRTRLWNSAARYGGAGEECDLDTIAEYAVDEFRESTKEPIARQWNLVAKALALDHVDPALVWYPPGARWTDRETDPEKFDAGYAFWHGTSGSALAEKNGERFGHPLALLPHIDGQQSMPIVRDVDVKDPKKLPGKKP